MKHYEHFSVDDFLKDEFFLRWVLHPHPDTDHFWEKWMENHPEKLDTVNKARMFVERMNYRDQFAMSDADYTRIFENLMRYKKQRDSTRAENGPRRQTGFWGFPVAAAILLLATALITLFVSDFWFFSRDFASETALGDVKVEAAPPGSRLSLVLPDGTKVKLNGGSKISYSQNFEAASRTVYLQGEAFLQVTRDENRPFVIHVDGLKTRVLGTSFNIRANRKEVRVAVVEGLVQVTTAQGSSSMVRPDSIAVYKQEERALTIQKFNLLEEIGWKDDILFFEKTPLKDVFEKLESWYGVSIVVSGDVSLNEPYSGKYHEQSLENVLSGIGYTSGFNYSIQEKKVTVFKSNPAGL